MELLILAAVIIGFGYFVKAPKGGSRRHTAASYNKPSNGSKRLSIAPCDSIMRHGEKRMFALLSEALPEHYVFPQVSFNALVTHAPHIYGSYVTTVRQKFHHKFVDFVVCDRATMEVFAVVEYDGSGHNKKHDEYRDGMLQSVGYRVERFKEADTLESIKARFGLGVQVIVQETQQIAQEETQF